MTTMEHTDMPATPHPEVSLDRLHEAVDAISLSLDAHDQLASALVAAQKLAADEVRHRLALQEQLRQLEADARAARTALATMRTSRTFRYTRSLRGAYGRVRKLRKRPR